MRQAHSYRSFIVFNTLTFTHDRLQTFYFFFFNDPANTEIYTLSLHDALPIWDARVCQGRQGRLLLPKRGEVQDEVRDVGLDRKSTRLNSSHGSISYAVCC